MSSVLCDRRFSTILSCRPSRAQRHAPAKTRALLDLPGLQRPASPTRSLLQHLRAATSAATLPSRLLAATPLCATPGHLLPRPTCVALCPLRLRLLRPSTANHATLFRHHMQPPAGPLDFTRRPRHDNHPTNHKWRPLHAPRAFSSLTVPRPERSRPWHCLLLPEAALSTRPRLRPRP